MALMVAVMWSSKFPYGVVCEMFSEVGGALNWFPPTSKHHGWDVVTERVSVLLFYGASTA